MDYLLQVRPDAVVLPFHVSGIRTVEGLTGYKSHRVSDDLKNTARIYPHMVNSWGFFIALIIKKRPL